MAEARPLTGKHVGRGCESSAPTWRAYDPRRRNRVNEVDVCHDAWCRIHRGGYCNCKPEVRLRRREEEN